MSEESMVGSYRQSGGLSRTVIVTVGHEYVVEPSNPRATRNRGRHVRVLGFVPVSPSHPRDIVAKVRYLDNNRVGRAELGNLVPLCTEPGDTAEPQSSSS
jgi:hypothetical protein